MCYRLGQLGRRKKVTLADTALPRVLTLLDLTALGIGSTIGVGFYVLAGEIARSTAGPAVTLSFTIAAFASVLSGLCYAEFGGRVPKAGSAYIYTYVCVGEFVAFIIGWNLILEYLIGTASVASGFSGYIDTFTGGVMSEALNNTMHMDSPGLAEYPNFLAAGLCLVLTAVLAFGVKESSSANNVVTGVNLVVVVYVIISVATRANVDNWSLTPENLTAVCTEAGDYGAGGFLPYGFPGVVSGAASCFYGFVGFDIIASTGEEAKKPERNLPMSICLSLTVIFLAYFGMSTVVTLAVPYCNLDKEAPLLVIYETLNMMPSYWIVSVGALFGFSASLLGAIFPMPRIIYAMAVDGLLFRPLARVSARFRSPVRATFLSGVLAAILATIFDVTTLVNMMSIGTLQAYTIVALCVMMLRFSVDPLADDEPSTPSPSPSSRPSLLTRALNLDRLKTANQQSTDFVTWATLVFAVLTLVTCVLIRVLLEGGAGVGGTVAVCVLGALDLCVLVCVARQPRSSTKMPFEAPLVPWMPALSAFVNLYLMVNLPVETWYKFIVWIVCGLLVYFIYSFGMGAANAAMDDAERERLKGVVNETFEPDVSPDVSPSSLEAGVVPPNIAPSTSKKTSIVPEINILPATPLASKHATPTSTLTKGPDRPKAIGVSPLVTADLARQAMKDEGLDESSESSASSSSESDQDESAAERIQDVEEDLVDAIRKSSQDDSAGVDGAANISEESQVLERREENVSESSISAPKEVTRPDSPTKLPTNLILNKLIDSETPPIIKDTNNRHHTLPAVNPDKKKLTKTQSQPTIESPVASISNPRLRHLVRTSSVDSMLENTSKPGLDRSRWQNLSFERIPPSSPDSPLAKRVQHFWVTPVIPPADPPNYPDNHPPGHAPYHPNNHQYAERVQEDGVDSSIGESLRIDSDAGGLLTTIRERGESKVSTNSSLLNTVNSVPSHDQATQF